MEVWGPRLVAVVLVALLLVALALIVRGTSSAGQLPRRRAGAHRRRGLGQRARVDRRPQAGHQPLR